MAFSDLSIDRLKKIRRLTMLIMINLIFVTLSVAYKIFAGINSEAMSCHVLESFLIPCPTCGGSRAVFYLLEFKVVKAFFYYPPIYYFISVFLYFDIKELVCFIKDRSPRYGKDAFILITLVPISIIAFFFLRAALLIGGVDMAAIADSLNF